MPELPEVETTLRGIEPFISQKVIAHVLIRERRLRWPVSRGLAAKITGEKILGVRRRSKYILILFRHGTILIHLGMSGHLRIFPTNQSVKKHDHIDLILTNDKLLRFHDPRRFGCFLWVEGDPLFSKQLVNLGPEPFDDAFCARMLFDIAKRRRTSVKNIIMDSRVVAGVCNIYVYESLFRSGISPNRSARRISLTSYAKLVLSIRQVLTEAINAGGTTLRDYSKVTGDPGYFAQQLSVYNREGKSCYRCAGIIRRKVTGQRSSFYCPRCQN